MKRNQQNLVPNKNIYINSNKRYFDQFQTKTLNNFLNFHNIMITWDFYRKIVKLRDRKYVKYIVFIMLNFIETFFKRKI